MAKIGRKSVFFAVPLFLLFLLSDVSHAQTSSIEGTVIGEDGKPLQDALIRIERLDIRGNYRVKTRRNGTYFHAGLPLGNYRVSVEVKGQMRDAVDNVRTRLGDSTVINFNLQEQAERQRAMQQAAEAGQLTQEMAREMTPEQRAAMEREMKERQESLAKNKALNDAFNEGVSALKVKAYEPAVEAFAKATEIDPKQHVVWAQLADAYMGLASQKIGDEQQTALTRGLESWQKAMELKPDDAAYYNNYALALARARRFDEAQEALTTAATIDPKNAGRYFYNLGAVLVNIGQIEPAGDAFKRAIEADPNYADAQYQYGVYLMSKASTTPDGKIVPVEGTREAFETYLKLQPNGQFAEAARGMLSTMEATIETEYVAPGARKPKPKPKQ